MESAEAAIFFARCHSNENLVNVTLWTIFHNRKNLKADATDTTNSSVKAVATAGSGCYIQ